MIIKQTYKNLIHTDKLDLVEPTYYECNFENIGYEGKELSSKFINCKFDEVNFYWATVITPIFIKCIFQSCDLRAYFNDVLFYDCTFINCLTGDDNLGCETKWLGAEVIDCRLVDTQLPKRK